MSEHTFLRDIRIFFFSIGLPLFFLVGCSGGDRVTFELESRDNRVLEHDSTASVDFFLETSVSMRGYVNAQLQGDYPLKDVIPLLITDLDNGLASSVNIYTVTDSPEHYNKSKNQFYSDLRNGSILNGKSSKLQNVFGYILDSLRENSVSILVTDCILDLGIENTMTQGSIATNEIYSHLVGKENVGVAVYKYLSDFNGTFYFDRENTGAQGLKQRPHYNEVLRNRPFYIWVMGSTHHVKKLLSSGVFENYEDSYSFNLNMVDVKTQLLKQPTSGKISIDEVKKTFTIKEATPMRPASFTLGLDLSKQPENFMDVFSDPKNYMINPDYLSKSISIQLYDRNLLNEDIKNKSSITTAGLTHFISPKFTEVDPAVNAITIVLHNPVPEWFEKTDLADDLNLSKELLEGKTFAFQYITNAFTRAFRNDTDILTINFKNQSVKNSL